MFAIAVTFQGDVMPNAELVDSYDRSVLRFVSASIGSAPLPCDAFPAGGTQGLVMCALGDASGPFTVTMRFTAIAPTTPGRNAALPETPTLGCRLPLHGRRCERPRCRGRLTQRLRPTTSRKQRSRRVGHECSIR